MTNSQKIRLTTRGTLGLSYTRSIIAGAVAILLGMQAPSQGEELEFQRETISAVVSPDNARVALVQEGVCSDGRLVTISTDTVQLARRDATDTIHLAPRPDTPQHDNDILVVDYYGHPENRPLVQWLSPQKLQITIPNFSGVGLQSSSYEGVNIIVKFEPDDPIARERWLREHRMAPN
jgi:hypothetical protein